jgi:hypothetical protein
MHRNGVDCTFPKTLPQTSALCDKFKKEQQALEDAGLPGKYRFSFALEV